MKLAILHVFIFQQIDKTNHEPIKYRNTMDKNMQSIYSAPELCMKTLQKYEIHSQVLLNINNSSFFFSFSFFYLTTP